MATPSASLAYVEIAPHSLQIAVLAGRKVVVSRAFSLDAKADLAAFVAEHGLSGTARASLLGARNFLYVSADAESGAVRQPAALQGHVSKLPHGFESAPVASVCDVANGLALDPSRATPWLLAAVDSGAAASAKETLSGLGLAPAELVLAAPAHFGVVASSLAADEVALVLVPGEDDASLVWVSAQGVKAIVSAPVGYAKIFEAVQLGLGLKFKAAAGKLFYNDNYDFSDVATKVAAPLAEAIKPLLQGKPAASVLHVAGLTPGQAWLVNQLSAALGIKPWTPAIPALTTKLGLEAGVAPQPISSLGVIAVAAAGSSDAAWVQPLLETLANRPGRSKAGAAPAQASAPVSSSKPAPKAGAASVEAKPASVKPGAGAASKPVESVAVQTNAKPAPAKSNKGPMFIGAGIVVAAVVVGLAMTMRGPKNRPATPEDQPATTQKAPVTSGGEKAPTPPPVAPPTPPPVVVTTPAVPVDIFAADGRKFGNDRYRLTVSDKGFLQSLSTARGEVLVEAAAGMMLQGSYVGTDGRRKPFNVGGVDDAGYVATVKKSVRDGATLFEVKVTHPRFELEQTFRCLADKVQIKARFNPINLRDPRGVISALHTVRLSPVAIEPSKPMRASDGSFAYTMKAGVMNLSFDRSVWARDGADGKQTVVAGENGVAFYFTDTTDAIRNQLDYEIAMP
jgi:hypothetical protein